MSRLVVHVTPRASRPGIRGWRAGELEVRASAPPEGGRANEEVRRLVADALDIPKSRVAVVRGQGSRHKELEIRDVSEAALRTVFGSPDRAAGGSTDE